MAYIVPSHPETLADRVLYTRGQLVEVTCSQCHVRVEVRKNSEHHTSIQWTREAVQGCAIFAGFERQEGGRPVYSGCPSLSNSIDEAVRSGTVPIGSSDE